VTFEETLVALHEIIGEPIDIKITVGAVGSPQVTIGFMKGTLVRAINRGPAVMPDLDAGPEAWNEHDAHFFAVGDAGNGFYVSPQAFRDARWLNDERQTLWIEHGLDVVIAVVRHPRD
jgi:hypothetical protein